MKPYVEVMGKRYAATQTDTTLMRVGRLWKRRAQHALRRDNRNTTGQLTKSMRVRTGMDKGDPYVDITPAVDYWRYVDGGVQGAIEATPYHPLQGRDPNNYKRRFKYTNKKPPVRALMQWIQLKGVQPRNEKGQYVDPRPFAFAIRNSIWANGLRPSFFISKTGDRIEERYAQSIGEAYGADLENALEQAFKQSQDDGV